MGRPLLKIDPAEIEKLAAIGCTTSEIAAFLNCSKDTIEKRFSAVLQKGRENMKSSIRRMQYETAAGGNPTMQIWLGKQYLGQTDKNEYSGDIGQVAGFRIEIIDKRKAG